MRLVLSMAVLLGFCASAWAQSASQPPIVTAPGMAASLDTVTHDFVQSYAAPAQLSGQLSRWRIPICPRTDGLSQDSYTAFVSQRIRSVAAMAGVALAPTPCQPNIQVVFTDDPQAFLNTAHARDPAILGYHGPTAANHAIQAWYVTGTADLDGKVLQDADVFNSGRLGSAGGNDRSAIAGAGLANRVAGSRLYTGLSSQLINVLIIADRTRTGSQSLAAVADDIAMMALSQTNAFDVCGPMPSVTNLMAADCPRTAAGLTDGDLAYLKGLYQISPERAARAQQSEIMAAMKKELSR